VPYDVAEHDAGKCGEIADDGWDVINKETKEVKDHHDEKPDAERQVRILTELEKEGDDE
jgi:hypothetical protein